MITVEEVRRADQRRRFHEVGRVVFANEPRWAPALRSYEAWLFQRTHPYRQRAEVVRFLARRRGEVAGRICAHHADASTDGWFGAFECADDPEAVAALVDAAAAWVADRGATKLAGPATFTIADEAGVLVAGDDWPGGTGRPWHPPWYAEHLTTSGLEPLARTFPRWRLPASVSPDLRPVVLELDPALPPHTGRLTDRRLVLTGTAGKIAAVPDIAATVRSAGIRHLRRSRIGRDEAAVVRLEGDAAVLVPALLRATAEAGYRHLWAPWSPDDRPPDTVHRLLGRNLR